VPPGLRHQEPTKNQEPRPTNRLLPPAPLQSQSQGRGPNSNWLDLPRSYSSTYTTHTHNFKSATTYHVVPHTHVHTHPGALVLRFSSIYTQHTLALLRNKQDAAPRLRHSKKRPLAPGPWTTPQQARPSSSTTPPASEGAPSDDAMRIFLSADDLYHMSLPPLPDLNLALLFSLIGIY
jgi:hypothetical protein